MMRKIFENAQIYRKNLHFRTFCYLSDLFKLLSTHLCLLNWKRLLYSVPMHGLAPCFCRLKWSFLGLLFSCFPFCPSCSWTRCLVLVANFIFCQDLGQRIGQIWDFCSLHFLLYAGSVSTGPVLLGWSLYCIERVWNLNLTHCVAMGGGTISPSQCWGFHGRQLLFWNCDFCRYTLYIFIHMAPTTTIRHSKNTEF